MNDSKSISIFSLIKELWHRKFLFFVITALFLLSSLVISLQIPDKYRATAFVVPAERAQGSGSVSQELGGFAAIAGINLPNSQTISDANLAVELMKSRSFVIEFISKNNLLPYISSAEGWDVETKEIIFDPEVFNADSESWVIKENHEDYPTYMEASSKFIDEILSITKNEETGLISISITYYSPEIAAEWVDMLVYEINEYMRKRNNKSSQKNLNYLNEQLSAQNIVQIKSMLYTLVEEQYKSLMFTEVRDEYIFETIDPALVPEKKYSPSRILIIFMGGLLGVMLSTFIIVFNFLWSKSAAE